MKLHAVILAGGEGKRMRGLDKPFVQLNGKPLFEHVLDRIRDHAGEIVVSVNDKQERFAAYGLPCVADRDLNLKTPLSGIYSALEYFSERSSAANGQDDYLLCVPVDVPVFPAALISKLAARAQAAESGICYTQSGEQPQPLFSVWALSSLPALRVQLQAGAWGVIHTLRELGADVLLENSVSRADFANINSPEDLATLESSRGEP